MSIDSGSAETHHSKDEGLTEPAALEIMPDTIPADAPRSPLGEVIEGLEEQGAPDSPHTIDPETHDVSYTPLDERSFKRRNARWIGGGAVAALAAGTALFFGLKGDDKDPDATRPTTGTTAPAVPGQSPSPEVTASSTEAVSPLEAQKKAFERATIPTKAVSIEFLTGYVNSDISLYTGTETNAGLFEAVNQVRDQQRIMFNAITPEDIIAAQDRYYAVLDAKYPTVVDGKPAVKPAAEFFRNAYYGAPKEQASLQDTMDMSGSDKAAQAHALATVLAGSADNFATAAIVESLKSVVATNEYNKEHPDQPIENSPVGPLAIADSIFVEHDTDPTNAQDRVAIAERMMNGVSEGLEAINTDTAQIVEVHVREHKTADGKTSANTIGATILYQSTTGTPTLVTVVFVPVEKAMMPVGDQGEMKVMPVKNTFQSFVVAKAIAN